jgi:hypothetical protein
VDACHRVSREQDVLAGLLGNLFQCIGQGGGGERDVKLAFGLGVGGRGDQHQPGKGQGGAKR